MAPLDLVATLLANNRVPSALSELKPQTMWQALDGSVREMAVSSGWRAEDVWAILPTPSLRVVLNRVARDQAEALFTWQGLNGPFGLMDLTADVDTDPASVGGSAVSAAGGLLKLSQKVAKDRQLAVPLQRLASDVAEWEALVDKSSQLVASGALALDYRRKRIQRTALVLLPFCLLATGLAAFVFALYARSQVDRLQSEADPCVADKISFLQARLATPGQRQRHEQLSGACTQQMEQTAQLQRDQLAREQLERQARKAAELHKADCEILATSIKDGKPVRSTTLTAPEFELISRIQNKALLPADLGPEPTGLPCEATSAKLEIEAAFAGAILSDTLLWARKGDPSPLTHRLLVAHRDQLSRDGLIGLADEGERLARTGLIRGDLQALARAKRLCRLAEELGVPGHGACEAVGKLPQ